MAHPQTNFSSNFQGVDPPLEGYWHDGPIPCGGGNVVTDIWPNPAGVPVVVKGFNALTDEDIADKLDNTGNASNTTSTFTKASGDTSTITSGSKLSAIFTAISSFLALLKALAFKDKVSDSDINGAILDSHIASASTWNGKQDSLGINASSGDTGKFLNEKGAFATPNYPSVPSVINNLTSTSTTDALSAAQGKALNDNKQANLPTAGTPTDTYAIDISGSASQLSHLTSQNEASTWRQIAKLESSDENRVLTQGFVVAVRERINSSGYYTGTYIVSCTSKGSDCRILQGTRLANGYDMEFVVAVESDSITLYAKSGPYSPYHITALFGNPVIAIGNALGSKPAGTDITKTFLLDTSGQVGNSTTPIYVDYNGQVKACPQGSTLKSNTATLYIAGTFGEGNIPYYNVKDIKNGCVNYVHVKDIPYNTCSITIEAPTLASGEEYDYVVVFDTFTNSNLVGSIDVENCKPAGHMDNGVFVVDSMVLSSGNPQYVPMIIVTGNVVSSKWYDRT